MAFKGITFAGQNVTPKNDGGLYASHYGDGILMGCEMSLSGDDLVIQSGEFIMNGRVVQVDGATNVDLSGRTLQTGYIQVIMNADMSQPEGSQWYTSFVESATTTFPALTQEDINLNGNLYQMQLVVVQISGGNLTNLSSPLTYSTVIVQSPTAKGTLRPSVSSGSVLFGAENGNFVFRPHSIENSADQMVIDSSGALTVRDNITVTEDGNAVNINPTSTDPYLYLQQNGDNKGQLYYASANGILALNSIAGGRINIYDTGQIYINGSEANIYIRPNGTATGQIYYDTSGQQCGGHPMKSASAGSSTKNISNSTGWTNLASLTGLTTGTYLFYGKSSFSVNATADALISLCISTGSNNSNASYNSSCFTRGFTVYPSIAMLLSVSQSTMYLNIQSNGVAGTAGTWYFRAVRID